MRNLEQRSRGIEEQRNEGAEEVVSSKIMNDIFSVFDTHFFWNDHYYYNGVYVTSISVFFNGMTIVRGMMVDWGACRHTHLRLKLMCGLCCLAGSGATKRFLFSS